MRMRPDRRIERLVLLPFTMGCVSESSVALAHHHHHTRRRRSASASTAAAPTDTTRSKSRRRREMDDDEESLSSTDSSDDSKSSTSSSSTSPSSNISARFHRILRTVKSTFVYKEEDDGEDEMEIGVPTDVKHVTHIGWDDDDIVGAASAAITSSTITATTNAATRVNNPTEIEHHDRQVSSGCRDSNNPITTDGHYQPHQQLRQLLMCHHHRRPRPSSYEDQICIDTLAEAGPVLPRRQLSVISPSSAST
ncbi:unnamed protein product [Linum tenue]|uniref:CRIB domain-containing protein n=1 Tax=Linum tenue TaxID=586396 RepID=A0AAV0LXW8_9ROSI|nr:unnamed protein product [Linum tenue]